jgi:hypothetical protein
MNSISANIAAVGDPAQTAQLGEIQQQLVATLQSMEADGVTAEDIATLARDTNALLNIADDLDTGGLHDQAAQLRELAGEISGVMVAAAKQEAAAAHEAGVETTTPLTAAEAAELDREAAGFTQIAAEVAAEGDSRLAAKLTADEQALEALEARVKADGVDEADITELTALHDDLIGIADELEAEGDFDAAARVRGLAADLAATIAEMAAEQAAAEDAAGNPVAAEDDRAVEARAEAAEAADRARETLDMRIDASSEAPLRAAAALGSASPQPSVARNVVARTEVTSIPTGRAG